MTEIIEIKLFELLNQKNKKAPSYQGIQIFRNVV